MPGVRTAVARAPGVGAGVDAPHAMTMSTSILTAMNILDSEDIDLPFIRFSYPLTPPIPYLTHAA